MPDRNTEETSSQIVRDLLSHAIPVSPTNPQHYVTKDELVTSVKGLEQKIENSALRQKLWVLSGVIAIMLTFGGGYISIVSKIDRLTEALPLMSVKLEERGQWIQRQERKDAMQDSALHQLDNSYQPLPYVATPQ